jgi:hypothetical protein
MALDRKSRAYSTSDGQKLFSRFSFNADDVGGTAQVTVSTDKLEENSIAQQVQKLAVE